MRSLRDCNCGRAIAWDVVAMSLVGMMLAAYYYSLIMLIVVYSCYYFHADVAVKVAFALLRVAVTVTGGKEAAVEVVEVDGYVPPILSVFVGFDTPIVR